MDLLPALKNLGEMYTVKRLVKFEVVDMTVSLQTLSAIEEVKVLESCKDFDGSQYLQTLKRNSLAYAIRGINGQELSDEIPSEDGSKQSRFLFFCKYLDEWPAPVRDTLFDVFTDMNIEMEKKVAETAKFARFALANPDLKEAQPLFRPVDDPGAGDGAADSLQKKVEEEIASEDAKINAAG